MKASFWQDRPTLVTGATGLLGGWLIRRLLELGADIVCLVRDWVPQSELVHAQLVEQVIQPLFVSCGNLFPLGQVTHQPSNTL